MKRIKDALTIAGALYLFFLEAACGSGTPTSPSPATPSQPNPPAPPPPRPLPTEIRVAQNSYLPSLLASAGYTVKDEPYGLGVRLRVNGGTDWKFLVQRDGETDWKHLGIGADKNPPDLNVANIQVTGPGTLRVENVVNLPIVALLVWGGIGALWRRKRLVASSAPLL